MSEYTCYGNFPTKANCTVLSNSYIFIITKEHVYLGLIF
jgi:hypothetical protein